MDTNQHEWGMDSVVVAGIGVWGAAGIVRRGLVSPLQGFQRKHAARSQGVALGYPVVALRAGRTTRTRACLHSGAPREVTYHSCPSARHRESYPLAARRHVCDGGYALLEMLVYIVVFAMALNLMVSLLGTGARLAATTTLGLGRMEGIREVQDEFTKRARRAVAVEARVGAYDTGADRVVLKMPPGQEEGFDYVVMGALRQPDRFSILGLAQGDSGLETVYLETLRQPLQVLTFEIDPTGMRPVVHLNAQVKLEEGERARPFLIHRSSAALRGTGQ